MAKGRQYSFASQFAAIAALLLFSVGTSAAFQIRLPFFSLPNDNVRLFLIFIIMYNISKITAFSTLFQNKNSVHLQQNLKFMLFIYLL